MALLETIPTLSAKDFTWTGSVGATFASDIGYRPGQIPGSRLYDDACDIGFRIAGRNENLIFVYAQDVKSLDGTEISGWVYHSLDYRFSVTIYND